MNLQFVSEDILEDNDHKIVIKTTTKDLVFIGYVLETLEGFCNFTTIDKNKVLLKIVTTSDFYSDVKKMLLYLKQYKIKVK